MLKDFYRDINLDFFFMTENEILQQETRSAVTELLQKLLVVLLLPKIFIRPIAYCTYEITGIGHVTSICTVRIDFMLNFFLIF